MSSRSPLLILAFATTFVASGCRDEKITTYRIPKEIPPAATSAPANPHAGLSIPVPAAAPADMAATPVPTATGGDLTWTSPATWQSRPASAMRKATFILPGDDAGAQAELAVTAFPGDVGGNLANVNRQQLGLAPLAAEELDSVVIHIHVGDLHIDVAELLGPAAAESQPRQRVLGAIVPFNGATWFFKLSGPDALVAAKKNEFIAFLDTLQPAR
jgi:hypothetical protein